MSKNSPLININSILKKFDYNSWMNSKEASLYLSISEGALRNMTSNGDIPYYKLGRRNRYLKNDLDLLMFGNKRGKL